MPSAVDLRGLVSQGEIVLSAPKKMGRGAAKEEAHLGSTKNTPFSSEWMEQEGAGGTGDHIVGYMAMAEAKRENLISYL